MVKRAGLVMAIVFIAAIAGILSRPFGSLASIWLANAVLLSLFLRNPNFASPLGWAGAFLAFLAADLVTGTDPAFAFTLSVANLAGVAVGFVLFRRLPRRHRRLREPISMAYLFLISGAASLTGSVIGSLGQGWHSGAAFWPSFRIWFVSELMNYIVLLSVLLSAPRLHLKRRLRRLPTLTSKLGWWLPVLAAIASTALGAALGGYGAIAIAVPALLWCALRYRIFPVAVVTALYAVPTTVILAQSATGSGFSVDSWGLISLRLGVMMVVAAPLTLNVVQRRNKELMEDLARAANHDSLTGVLSRRALIERLEEKLRKLRTAGVDIALLILDVDHFKRINDAHGHSVGDQMLVRFTQAVAEKLRHEDVIGRLGGEEFAVLLPRTSAEEALVVAERIRASVAAAHLPIGDASIACTTSIGVVTVSGTSLPTDWRDLVRAADGAMYQAKAAGRNRVASVELSSQAAV
jgi:diguanylate cyclase (GGDEF)-like protein